jgi:hypothetical protein
MALLPSQCSDIINPKLSSANYTWTSLLPPSYLAVTALKKNPWSSIGLVIRPQSALLPLGPSHVLCKLFYRVIWPVVTGQAADTTGCLAHFFKFEACKTAIIVNNCMCTAHYSLIFKVAD